LNSIFNTEVVGTEVQSALNHIHHDDIDLRHELEKFEARKSNGASADHDNGFPWLGIATVDCVVSDSESFYEGKLVVRKLVADMKLSGWDSPVCFAKSAGAVDADYLNAWAAVTVSLL
jgi:hypothetical protein